MREIFLPWFAMLLMLAGTVHAAGSHVHGSAQLHVVADGDILQVELIAPLDSLLGFEHMPRNKRQRKAVQNMAEKFRQPDLLFVPSEAAGCSADPAQLISPVLIDGVVARYSGKEEGHAELEALVTFRCEFPSALKTLEVRLFDAFPRVRKVQAQVASPRGQSGAVLTPQRPRLQW